MNKNPAVVQVQAIQIPPETASPTRRGEACSYKQKKYLKEESRTTEDGRGIPRAKKMKGGVPPLREY